MPDAECWHLINKAQASDLERRQVDRSRGGRKGKRASDVEWKQCSGMQIDAFVHEIGWLNLMAVWVSV